MTKKYYQNIKTGEETTKAAVAMAWHREGINIYTLSGYEGTNPKLTLIPGASQKTNSSYEENYNHCEYIGLTIQEYIDGRVYRCPDCDKLITVPEDWSGEKYKCSNCGTIHEERDLNPQTLWDYFENDIYDIEYRIGTGKEYRSVRVMVACGGPNIYIDTKSGCVELYWWTESAKYHLMRDAIEEIDNYFEEMFECL